MPFLPEGTNGKLFSLIPADRSPYSDDLKGLWRAFSGVLVLSVVGEWRKLH